MHYCNKCSSTRLNKRGTKIRKRTGEVLNQYFCKDCGNRFNVAVGTLTEKHEAEQSAKVEMQLTYDKAQNKKLILTSYQVDTEYNKNFVDALLIYAEANNAEFYLLTNAIDDDNSFFPEGVKLVRENFNIGDDITVYSQLNISKTTENPLIGLDGLSKGKSLIVGHPTLQMKTLPVFGKSHPIMLTTTGTISKPTYNTSSKSGAKAEHNHSYSALVLELDVEDNIFHIRVLNSGDEGSFYDLDKFYNHIGYSESHRADAIILGDTHVTESCELVNNATFAGEDSIVNTLKPKAIVHHDVLDFGILQSHHNSKSFIKRYEKYVQGKDSVVAELSATAKYIVDNTPDFVEDVVIVSSNHNDHLVTYLENVDIKYDYKNAKLYHYLMYRILVNIEAGKEVNPFQIFFEDYCKNVFIRNKVKFLGREDLYYINNILVSSHGDRGSGGVRFSPTQGKKYPSKMVVGHSHSPSINAGLYVTGTMTGKLDYTEGTPSGWMNTHCVIHPNGRRQLISIINGKWRVK